MKVFLFAALSSLLFLSAQASQNVYLISKEDNSFISSGAPVTFCVNGFSSLIAAVTGLVPGQKISKSASQRIESIVKPDPFSKPRAYVAFDVAGLGEEDVAELTKDKLSRTIVVDSKESIAVNNALAKVLRANQGVSFDMIDQLGFEACDGNCMESHMDGVVSKCGMKHERGEKGDESKLVLKNGKKISVNSKEEKLFSLELSSMYAGIERLDKDLKSSKGDDVQILNLEMSGLVALANKYGANSDEVVAARQAIVSLLNWAMDTLEDAADGSVVFQVATPHVSGKTVKALADRKEVSKRHLLTSSWYTNTTDEAAEAKLFTTKAAGYGSFVLLLYFALAGVYCMCFMPFKKDTLLYASGKKDQ